MGSPPQTDRRFGRSHLLFATAALCFARPAMAQDSWIAGNGNWSNPANWSPAAVPGKGDNVNIGISNAASFAVTYDYTGPAVTLGTLTLNMANAGGTATAAFSMSANTFAAANENIGNGGEGAFNQSSGTNSAAAINLNTNGTYSMTGGTLTCGVFNETGGSVSFLGLFVDPSDVSTFNQSGGTNTINTSGDLVIGSSGGTSANLYLLSGSGVLNAKAQEFVGYAANGTFNQTGGTNTLAASFSLTVGAMAGSTGTYSLSGTGLLALSGGTENLGGIGVAVFNQTGGTNSNPGNSLILGTQSGTGSGTYLLSAGSLAAHSEIIGSAAVGIFNQSGGTNTISNQLNVGEFAGSTGTYTLSASGTLSDPMGAEQIGADGGVGYFNQTGGANTAGTLYLGNLFNSPGTFTLSGGTTTINGIVYVAANNAGQAGTGTLTISNTGKFSAGGTMIVDNNGTVNINGGSASVGGLSISGGGVVNINAALAIDFGSAANDPIKTIVGYLTNGYTAATTWTGASATSGVITSTSAVGSHTVTLGYLDGNIDTGLAAVQPNQILVKYVLVGDSDLSGEVDFTDLAAVLKSFNQSGTDWAQGNFEYAANSPSIASTNFNDLADVLKNFLQTTPSGSGEALGGTVLPLAAANQIQTTDTQLPEPASLSLLAAGAAGLLGRRRRKWLSPHVS